jgi:hypothetical protein
LQRKNESILQAGSEAAINKFASRKSFLDHRFFDLSLMGCTSPGIGSEWTYIAAGKPVLTFLLS